MNNKLYLWPPARKLDNYPENESDIYKKNKYGYPRIVEKFEEYVKRKFKVNFCLSLNSGTSALQAAYFSIGLKNNDEVIVPNITFHATVTPLLNYNCKIILCDVDVKSGNICTSDLKKKITSNTKAVVITHLCGYGCDMDEILRLKKKYKFFLIEDCSHAHLSKFKNKLLGTFGDISIFSMDTNKLLSTGEGGFLLTNSRKIFENSLLTSDFGPRLSHTLNKKLLKNYGETGIGFKHRIHPYSALLALSEFKKLKTYIKKRHEKLNYLSDQISKLNGISPPISDANRDKGAYYSYRPFFYEHKFFNLNLDKFINLVKKEGLDIRRSGNEPIDQLPIFKLNKKVIFNTKDLKNSKLFYHSTFSLPTFTFEKYSLINKYIRVFKKIEEIHAKKN